MFLVRHALAARGESEVCPPMHVAPAEFRAVRRDGVLLSYALLEDIVFVLADFPETGSRDTFAEQPCVLPHWGFALTGDVLLELGDDRHPITPGTAFHVPAGIPHRWLAGPGARLAAFDRVPPDVPTTEEALAEAGFETVRVARGRAGRAIALVRSPLDRPPDTGEIVASSTRMGDLVFTRARLGPRTGYTSAPCDVPHWGLVTSGSLAIEWEDSVEIVTAGDVFLCPAGPPAHRLQAADPAVVIDFTPVDALDGSRRTAEWRIAPVREALVETSPAPQLKVAALL